MLRILLLLLMLAATGPARAQFKADTITGATDTSVHRGALEQAFLDKETAGTQLTTEHGPVAFFASAAAGSTLFAFSNTAARGTVIKVYNPGNGRAVYAKVIGPLPGNKQYAGAIAGVSAAAKKLLGVAENRAWCELSYAAW